MNPSELRSPHSISPKRHAGARAAARPRSRLRAACLTALALALPACATTKVITKWQEPTVTRIAFTKILALCVSNEQALRRTAEQALCGKVAPVSCEPAYSVIADSELTDLDKAKAAVHAKGFDGAVVFRVVSDKERVTYVPPSYGPTFWGYYGRTMPMAYDPGYYRSDQVVRVETSIYSVARDQLLWVGTTETINPKNVPDLIDGVAQAVRGELQKEKLIPSA